MKLADMQVESYLELVASDAPAPGGGSASALCGAQGIGLVAMVARLTLGKKKFAEFHEICEKVAKEAEDICDKLTRQIDIDTKAYGCIADAFKLPKDTEQQKTVRRQAIADATLYAAEVPLETMRLGLQGLECTQKLIGNYNTNCASDVGCGVYGMLSCVKGAWLNVLINVDGISDAGKAGELREKGAAIAARAEEITKALEEEVKKAICD